MKKTGLILLLTLPLYAFSQVDYCNVIAKAVQSAAQNFTDQKKFAYTTVDGHKAYRTDFSFVSGDTGFVYRDSLETEVYFYQQVSNNSSDFSGLYKKVEQCLVADAVKWVKVEGGNNSSVLFTQEKTGATIILVSGNNGIYLQIARNKSKSIAVIGTDYCAQLKSLAASCNNDFEGFRQSRVDSSFLGVTFKSSVRLNQRNMSTGTIILGMDFLDKSKKDNSYTEMFDGDDIGFAEVLAATEQCLTTGDGWTQSPDERTGGARFTNGEVEVFVRTGTTLPGDSPDTFISIESDY